ncbi:related to dolichyl-phosphate-mannose-glycolipid alpha-mannosyltransferase [Phialocephala subalpina]|uniref:Mannosyltransferase n=1 Tax=Phialocephala subalpina TaxID=576137 RepID=A0A1L7WZA6_9HELO|nr:related to dolichyl-phosphate-mannose-glycolipid alpha-mannosyltransferase [Phialocephala subalpina]
MSSTTRSELKAPTNATKGDQVQPPEYPQDNDLHHLVNEQSAKDTWMLLLVFRCVNAALVWTFFQPDEYFQSLEPAWQMAFGSQSGAWITWEWHHQLRSSLHPALFAIVYYGADNAMQLLSAFPQFRGMILALLPNLVQAYFAALSDYYTWQLSERIYGTGSNASWVAIMMSVLSPWNWFCSTRTFSNSLETTLTIVAVYFWPWGISSDTVLSTGSDLSQAPSEEADEQAATPAKKSESGVFEDARSVKHLRIALLLAGTAAILRPTNLFIWFCVFMPTVSSMVTGTRASFSDYLILLREAVLCGSSVLLVSAASDFYYFGEWTFPPYQWLNFNVNQDLAVFYGRNDWHYYLSQGLPLLLTANLPFGLVALYHTTALSPTNIRAIFAHAILFTLTILSLISHKEVRFIYPLLPLLHIIAAPTTATYFLKTTTTPPHPKSIDRRPKTTTTTLHQPLLHSLLLLNLLIAGYTTTFHQRGVISVTKFLRNEYELLALDGRGQLLSSPDAGVHDERLKKTDFSENETFAAFLMPCHSTPWRSQLYHSGLKAWALTCEPPIHLAKKSQEREAYRDEADRFYDDPLTFLKEEVGTKERPWPRYVVGFEGIEGVLKKYYEEMKGHKVQERWRTFNSHWHDDSRRTGDVVVWEFVDGSQS